MNRQYFAVGGVFLVGFVFLLWPGFGWHPTFVQGDSMEPVFEDGCHLTAAEKVDGSVEEGDIVTFDANYIQGTEKPISHRVIRVYDEYDPERAEHQIDRDGRFTTPDHRKQVTRTSQPESYMEELNGETVYIFQGDNVDRPDPELVTEDQLLSRIHPHYSVEVPERACEWVP